MTDKIVADLKKLGINKGENVLLHSSLRSLGYVEGGADTVINAFLEAVGEEGTLLVPALSYASVGKDNPVFNAAATPCCVGAVAETFRRRPGVIRSLSPTHSVCALGKRAEEFCGEHQKDNTPCGPHSPFYKLAKAEGKICMLGCGLKPNTSMHGVEELVEPPYLFSGEEIVYQITDTRGRCFPLSCKRHGFAGTLQRYDRLENILPPAALKQGFVMQATCYVIDAAQMWEKAEKQLIKNPLYFVDQE